MGARAEALAKKFETKAQEATAVIERLSDTDWKKVTSAEKWSVGVAAALLRGLGDAELDRSGAVIQGVPAMSAEQLAGGLLCGHVDEHLGSIRATVGA